MLTAADLKDRFRARGLRITPQREVVFCLLEETQREHPTAEALYVRATRHLPSMSLRTIYAILDELEALGAIRPLDLGTGSTRFCTNPARHHHLVCERCGKVKNVFLDAGPVEVPPEQRAGFWIKEQAIVFRGLCADCQTGQPSLSG